MARLYIGLGSNLGDKAAALRRATEELNVRVGTVVSQSAFYETDPWGFQSEHPFLNAAVGIDTTLAPLDALRLCQQIEREMGRTHKSVQGRYADRVIDIDLLLYADLVMRTDSLTLPHPLMHKRLFVLRPLAEIAGDVVHPIFHKNIRTLLEMLLG